MTQRGLFAAEDDAKNSGRACGRHPFSRASMLAIGRYYNNLWRSAGTTRSIFAAVVNSGIRGNDSQRPCAAGFAWLPERRLFPEGPHARCCRKSVGANPVAADAPDSLAL